MYLHEYQCYYKLMRRFQGYETFDLWKVKEKNNPEPRSTSYLVTVILLFYWEYNGYLKIAGIFLESPLSRM